MDSSKFQKALLKNIEKKRKEKGMTYIELAARSEMEKSNVIRIMNGKGNFTISTLYKLAKGLDVPVIELFKF
jgi:transcriptional regulator with XRE-family HTH domain